MFKLLAIAALSILAEQNSNETFTRPLAKTPSHLYVSAEYSEEKVAFSDNSGEISNPEYAEDKDEVTEVFEEPNVEIDLESSLKGVIEKETAHLLRSDKLEEESKEKEELNPVLEDLSGFIQPTAEKSPPAGGKSNQAGEKLDSYEKLPISGEDKKKIAQILTTMAENNVFRLLFEKKRLERLGHEVNHVHPVRFLGTVFQDPELVQCLHQIRTSGFKWGGFIDGFSARLNQEIEAGNINVYIPGLAEELGVRAQDIQSYINQNNIEGLILFLLDKARS